jgi:S-methylmethionine-dependent homocysteine/selenocysteine methylase
MSTTTSTTLPQLGSGLFLTDGGIETSLIFIDGLDLPNFAAFHLLRDKTGRDALVRYYERYIAIAQADGVGFILESPTWRASSDWGSKLGYSRDAIGAVNRESIELMHELKARHAHRTTPIVVSGCVGPRGDGYDPGQVMSPTEAAAYHAHQIGVFAEAKADMTTAITMTNASEAIGFVHAAAPCGLTVCGVLHGGDGWTAADRAEFGRSRRRSGRRDRQCSCLLYDQLRAPDSL